MTIKNLTTTLASDFDITKAAAEEVVKKLKALGLSSESSRKERLDSKKAIRTVLANHDIACDVETAGEIRDAYFAATEVKKAA